MLSNAYFLAKFRFDTAENEPAKNLQNFAKFANFANLPPAAQRTAAAVATRPLHATASAHAGRDGRKVWARAVVHEGASCVPATPWHLIVPFFPSFLPTSNCFIFLRGEH